MGEGVTPSGVVNVEEDEARGTFASEFNANIR
jgi:hypothetical protein